MCNVIWRVVLMNKRRLEELLKKKELEADKEMKLEKRDLLALILAAASVFLPIILGVMILFYVIAVLLF